MDSFSALADSEKANSAFWQLGGVVMKKSLLVIIMALSVITYLATGCGKKSESPEPQEEANTETTVKETIENKEPQKCENHNAEITIPGNYSTSADSTDSKFVYVNSDGNKIIGFTYVPNIEVDDAAAIPWDNIVDKLTDNLTIDTYEEISVSNFPGIKFFFSLPEGYAGEMAMIVHQNDNSGYIIQMFQSGEFDDEKIFDEILSSFHITQVVVNENEANNTEETAKNPITDMELLTFEGHPKYLDDYDDAKSKWGDDKRIILCNGNEIHDNIENTIIYAESRGTTYIGYNKYKNNKIESIEFLLDNCNDEASTLSLEDVIPIIKEYLPQELMNEKYHIEDSVQWPEDGRKVYYISYKLNDDISDDEYDELGLTEKIAVSIHVNKDGNVDFVRINEMGVVNYLGEEYSSWNYDFLN